MYFRISLQGRLLSMLHGHRPGLNKVRQRGVWGDIPPSRGLGTEPPLGKGGPADAFL